MRAPGCYAATLISSTKRMTRTTLRLNRRLMRAFWSFLDNLQLVELHLHGRLYTWSNEQTHLMHSPCIHVLLLARSLPPSCPACNILDVFRSCSSAHEHSHYVNAAVQVRGHLTPFFWFLGGGGGRLVLYSTQCRRLPCARLQVT
jgi:hypothetical protein